MLNPVDWDAIIQYLDNKGCLEVWAVQRNSAPSNQPTEANIGLEGGAGGDLRTPEQETRADSDTLNDSSSDSSYTKLHEGLEDYISTFEFCFQGMASEDRPEGTAVVEGEQKRSEKGEMDNDGGGKYRWEKDDSRVYDWVLEQRLIGDVRGHSREDEEVEEEIKDGISYWEGQA